jgi:hypothetical protein
MNHHNIKRTEFIVNPLNFIAFWPNLHDAYGIKSDTSNRLGDLSITHLKHKMDYMFVQFF